MRQSACYGVSPIRISNYASVLNSTPVDQASDSLMVRFKAVHFSLLWPELFCLSLGPPVFSDSL